MNQTFFINSCIVLMHIQVLLTWVCVKALRLGIIINQLLFELILEVYFPGVKFQPSYTWCIEMV